MDDPGCGQPGDDLWRAGSDRLCSHACRNGAAWPLHDRIQPEAAPIRAGPNWAELGRAGPNWAEPGRTGPNRAGPNRAEPAVSGVSAVA